MLAWSINPNGLETKLKPNTHTLLVSKNGKSSLSDTQMVSMKDDTRRTLNLTFWPSLHISNILQQKRRHLRPLWWSPISWPSYDFFNFGTRWTLSRFKVQVLTMFGRIWILRSIFNNHLCAYTSNSLVLCYWTYQQQHQEPLFWPFGIIPNSQTNRCHLLNHSTTYLQRVHFLWNKTSMHHPTPEPSGLIFHNQFLVPFTFLQTKPMTLFLTPHLPLNRTKKHPFI
jgi:hypothetical protein